MAPPFLVDAPIHLDAGAAPAVMDHDGPFDDLDQTYGALGTAVAELGLSAGGPIRELYVAADLTEVCWPIVPGDVATT